MNRTVAILGDGGWGTALGLHLLRQGHRVRVWGPFPDYVRQVRERGENVFYLPGVPLPPELAWVADRAEAVAGADVVVLAVPSKFFRDTVGRFAGLIPPGCAVVSVAKGLDPQTRRRMTETAESALGLKSVAALSGPSFAEEVARGVPTAVVVACADPGRAEKLQAAFNGPRFRVYTSDDVIGVELGGALKNVIAIAVGVCDGIGFGENTRAAVITRGLAEITRLGVALGAHAATFAGLSGIGDLVVTCTSRRSRNHTVGVRLGRGERLAAIVADMKQVAEGITNAAAARAVAQERQVAVPITEQICAVLHEGRDPHAAVEALLTREPRPERDA
jgi:glycerol-3-phosphate dehydrogenase (NAD(P)+)